MCQVFAGNYRPAFKADKGKMVQGPFEPRTLFAERDTTLQSLHTHCKVSPLFWFRF